MPFVSADWTKQINTNLRRAVEFKVSFFIEELDFREAATIEDNGHLWYSDTVGLLERRETQRITATAETGMFLTDGRMEVEREGAGAIWNYKLDGSWQLGALPFATAIEGTPYQGFVSSGVSNLDGTFSRTWNYRLDGSWRLGEKPFVSGSKMPVVEIIEDNYYYDFSGISITFDTFNNDYPTYFYIEYYRNTQMIHQQIVPRNNTPNFSSFETVSACNRIVLTFVRTFNFNRRIRITDLTFGVSRVFLSHGKNAIISLNRTMWLSPIMREIPQNDFTVTIRDSTKEYNPENPEGVYKFTQRGQLMTVAYYLPYTITRPDGTTIDVRESFQEQQMYLTEPPTTKGEDVTFTASGKLQQLTQIYNRGRYYTAGRSYYDLFVDLFTFANWPLYNLPATLQAFMCYVPLPIMAVNALMQMLCQDIGYIITEDVKGFINIHVNNTEMMDYDLKLGRERGVIKDYPEYAPQLPMLRNLIINSKTVTVESAETELHKSTQSWYGTQTKFIDYEASTNQKLATITNGTLVRSAFYAYGCELTITANSDNMEIIITGNVLRMDTNSKSYPQNELGEDAIVSPELLSSNTLRDFIAPFYAKYLKEGKRYRVEYLGDPALNPNDILRLQTRYVDNLPTMILQSEYEYNGGSSGVLELKNYD